MFKVYNLKTKVVVSTHDIESEGFASITLADGSLVMDMICVSTRDLCYLISRGY